MNLVILYWNCALIYLFTYLKHSVFLTVYFKLYVWITDILQHRLRFGFSLLYKAVFHLNSLTAQLSYEWRAAVEGAKYCSISKFHHHNINGGAHLHIWCNSCPPHSLPTCLFLVDAKF
jgi:hypothetical protein